MWAKTWPTSELSIYPDHIVNAAEAASSAVTEPKVSQFAGDANSSKAPFTAIKNEVSEGMRISLKV
jgi:hypothetical protein